MISHDQECWEVVATVEGRETRTLHEYSFTAEEQFARLKSQPECTHAILRLWLDELDFHTLASWSAP